MLGLFCCMPSNRRDDYQPTATVSPLEHTEVVDVNKIIYKAVNLTRIAEEEKAILLRQIRECLPAEHQVVYDDIVAGKKRDAEAFKTMLSCLGESARHVIVENTTHIDFLDQSIRQSHSISKTLSLRILVARQGTLTQEAAMSLERMAVDMKATAFSDIALRYRQQAQELAASAGALQHIGTTQTTFRKYMTRFNDENRPVITVDDTRELMDSISRGPPLPSRSETGSLTGAPSQPALPAPTPSPRLDVDDRRIDARVTESRI